MKKTLKKDLDNCAVTQSRVAKVVAEHESPNTMKVYINE